MDLSRKPLLTATLLFFGVGVSFYVLSPYPFAAICLILLILNPISCLPIIIIVPVIESILNLNEKNAIPVGTLMAGLLIPIMVWNILLTSPKLFSKAKKIFYLFLFLIVYGTAIALLQDYYKIDSNAIIQRNLINLLRLAFCFTIAYFLSGMTREKLLNGFKICVQMAPFIMILVVYYYIANGHQKGFKYAYLNLGTIGHGSFSGTLVAYSTLLFYNVYYTKKKYFKLLNLIALAYFAYLIFLMGSKNGLLSFVFMLAVTTVFFFIKGKSRRFMGMLALVVIAVSLSFSTISELPTSRRLMRAKTSTGVDVNTLTTGRADLWKGGIKGILSYQGLVGYGSTPLASLYITRISLKDKNNVLHNTPMEFTLQYGVFGLMAYIVLLYTIFRYFKYIYRKTKLRRLPPILLVPFLSFFSLTLSSMFLSWEWNPYWWYQIAIIFAIVQVFALSKPPQHKVKK